MKPTFTAIILASVLAAPSQASPADAGLSLMGIPLDKPLELPECPYRALSGGHLMYDDATSTCWQYLVITQRNREGTPPAAGQVNVLMPDGPDFLDPASATVSLDQGKVSLVSARLPDSRNQKAAFAWLKEHYGAPTTFEEAKVDNLYGETVPTIMATWNLPGGQVQFTGATTRKGNGVVSILSPGEVARLSMPLDLSEDDS